MRYAVSGTLSPDATTADTGEAAGTYNGQPYWMWTNDAGTWYLYKPSANWYIANSLDGIQTKVWNGGESIVGTYAPDPLTGATGTATVTKIDEYIAVRWRLSGEITVLKMR